MGSVRHDIDVAPVAVGKITFKGLKATNQDFLNNELKYIKSASTFGDIMNSLSRAHEDMTSLKIFRSVGLAVDKTTPTESNDLDLTVTVEEMNRLGLNVSASTTLDGQQQLELSTNVRNVFGRAERLDLSFGMNPSARTLAGAKNEDTDAIVGAPRTARDGTESLYYTAKLFFPRIRSTKNTLELSVFERNKDWINQSSAKENAKGFEATVCDASGRHSFSYEGALRNLTPVARSATTPPSNKIIDECMQPNLKSSLKYSFSVDKRIGNKLAPSGGFISQVHTEVAGLGGDASFFKSELVGQYFRPVLGDSLTLGITLRGGFVKSWADIGRSLFSSASPTTPSAVSTVAASSFASSSNSNVPVNVGIPSKVSLSDRYFISGSNGLVVRGFATEALGPVDYADALGGDVYTAGSVSLSTAVRQWDMRVHTFANAGNSIDVSKGDNLTSLFTNMRACVGVGLVFPTQMGRIETNLLCPVDLTSVRNKGPTLEKMRFSMGFGTSW